MSSSTNQTNDQDGPILYIMVIGFHHKKGCQIEYTYPELPKNPDDNTYILPNNWKHLASLALPDGSHNYEKDYIYFNLINDKVDLNNNNHGHDDHQEESNDESLKKSTQTETIFCVSCYRQINANELALKDAEVTRTTVQKSVCILSKLPLYGLLKIKLDLITCAYFEQKHFQETQLLKNAFITLNSSLKLNKTQSYFIGLTMNDLILQYQHKILVLFKLLLLEKKSLFYITPVEKLSNTIISLLSLIPNILDDSNNSLKYSSNMLDLNELNEITFSETFLNDLSYSSQSTCKSEYLSDDESERLKELKNDAFVKVNLTKKFDSKQSIERLNSGSNNNSNKKKADDFYLDNLISDDDSLKNYFNEAKLHISDTNNSIKLNKKPLNASLSKDGLTENRESAQSLNEKQEPQSEKLNKVTSLLKLDWLTSKKDDEEQPTNSSIINSNETFDLLSLDFGMPLNLFSKSYMLHPYLSLHYLEYLTGDIKGYLIGATNFLFKQRLANDIDVLVEFNQINIRNEDVKRQLQLTTADLRFADYIVKNANAHFMNKVNANGELSTDANMTNFETANWEGSDEWIRINFKWYLYSLLATIVKSKVNVNNSFLSKSVSTISANSNSTESDLASTSNFGFDDISEYDVDDFNLSFVDAFINTECFKNWFQINGDRLDNELKSLNANSLYKINHPFNGDLNINDIKLRLMHTFSSTESGRKLNKALIEGSKLVTNTGKAVVGGLNQAKSTFSSFLSNLSSKNKLNK